MEAQLLNIAIAPVIYKNKILLLKREKPPFVGLWGMPGGKAKFGEHIEDTIKREINEETGLEIEVSGIPAVLSEVFYDVRACQDYWHTIIFLCDVVLGNPGEIRESSEGKLKWFDLSNLSRAEIIPSDYEMIKKIVLNDEEKSGFYKIRMLSDGKKYKLDYFEAL